MSTAILRFSLLLGCMLGCMTAAAEQQSFQSWLEDLRSEAIERGISREILEATLSDLTPDERVIGFDRNQPEFVQTFEQYLSARVSEAKVTEGRELLREHRPMLESIEDSYGVEPAFLVSFWGLESGFGRYQGKYSVIRSLATLAWDPRRSAFFRNELFSALRIIEEGHVPPDRMLGGWAGAMGQNQFIPSSFLRYAVDFDGDGRKNIWTSHPDVWASIANYLRMNGWKPGESWGFAVGLADDFDLDDPGLKPDRIAAGCTAFKRLSRELPLGEWKSRGVSWQAALDIAPDSTLALVLDNDGSRQSYLVLPNFRAILRYNCANKYAVSIGLMADLIR